jgi:long-chain fatty acid transport protein
MVSSAVSATTGYFTIGYGAKANSMVGAVVSNPQDAIAASTNPAGMALVGERLDFGARFFSPNKRNGKLSTSVIGAGTDFGPPYDVEDESRRNLFIIPSGGFNNRINDRLWWGMSMYGNGGLNTTYDRNIYDETAAILFSGNPPSVPQGAGTGMRDTGTLGVDLAQAIFAPTIAMKVKDKHSVGVSLLLGVQRFSARGLGNFQCFTRTGFLSNGAGAPGTACAPGGFQSLTPGFVFSDGLTNQGNDWAYGAGARVGWIGEVHPKVTLGAAYASKVYMTEFDDYDELFAEDGDLDVPANFTLGATFKASPKVNLMFDYQRILYEDVNSISNPGPVPTAFGPAPPPGGGLLGTDNGMGFGWQDISVYRLAAEYTYDSQWTFRAGYSWNDQPIDDDQVLFNMLAPAVIEQHATVGFTYSPNDSSEWNFAYVHAFKETVDSPVTAFGIPGEIDMYQNSLELSYSLTY